MLHTDPGFPLRVGRGVTIGHRAVLHGCRIEDYALIGINAVVLNGAVIGRESLIGANSLVPEREVIPELTLAFGSPVRLVRTLSDEEVERLHRSAAGYAEKARRYLRELRRV